MLIEAVRAVAATPRQLGFLTVHGAKGRWIVVSRRYVAVLGLVVLAGVAGCTEGSPSGRGASSPSVDVSVLLPRQGGRGAPVGDQPPDAYSLAEITDGQVKSAIDKVDVISQAVMKRSGIPGMAVAVVHHGKMVFAKGYGVREVGKADAVTTDTVFQIASVSKSVSSTCVAKEVSDKRVSWSDPVVKYLPSFSLSDPEITKLATVGDFFAHRTGLPGVVGDDLEGIGFSRDQILSKLNQFPLDPFRTSYHYTNFGMTVGAEAVAQAVKTPWDQMCARDLFQPLGMTSSSYSHAQFETRSNKATLHVPVDGGYKPLYQRDPDAQAPSGGVSSTVGDLSSWMSMVLANGTVKGQPLIDASVLQQSFTPQVQRSPLAATDSRGAFYGYGVNLDTTSTGQVEWGHSGAFFIGASTAYAILPSADLGIVVLTNAAPIGVPEAVTKTFTDYVRTGTVERDWFAYFSTILAGGAEGQSKVAPPPPTSRAPARPLSSYVGTYSNAYVGDVKVTESNGVLTVTLGPQNLSAPLTHDEGDTFSWLLPGQTHAPVTAVTFTGGPAGGPPQTMTIEALTVGELTRS